MAFLADVYGKSKLMEMLSHQPGYFNGDKEVAEVIDTFCTLSYPDNIPFQRTVNDGMQMLWTMYDLGRIHGIRAERKRKKEAAWKREFATKLKSLNAENQMKLFIVIKAMTAMNEAQSKEYGQLQDKVKTLPEHMRDSFLDFLPDAAQRVLNGETCAQLWQYWQSQDKGNEVRYDKQQKEDIA